MRFYLLTGKLSVLFCCMMLIYLYGLHVMKFKPHKLRPLSNLLFRAAMLPIMPPPIAKLLAKVSSRFYYSLDKA